MAAIKTFDPAELHVRTLDVFGFLNVYGDARRELEVTVESCLTELSGVLTPRACYSEFDIKIDGDKISLGFTETRSQDLAEHLDGCKKIILIAATVGIGADRLISKYSVTEPSRALIMQAAGSAAIEAFLDRVSPEILAGREGKERFSCGYGDLPLEIQKDIFLTLECEKNIGLTLTGSLLMSPTKSVTAIIGIKK